MTAGPANPPISDRRLFRWMFRFLQPVKGIAFLAALYAALWIGAEILTVRQTAEAINSIKLVGPAPAESVLAPAPESVLPPAPAPAPGFWTWLTGPTAQAAGLRRAVLILACFSLTMGLLTYLREVANMKLSMHKVFYIREAVYDQLQRVGLRFHDQISTGELINRSLSDLQNVRTFINSAILVTLEIVLIVGGYIILLFTRSPLVALLALVPLPLWVWYVARFSRRIRPLQKGVMEVGDKNVSIITENIAGVHVVKAFAAEPYEIDKYGRNCDLFFTRVIHRIRQYANFAPVVRSISMASHLALFLFAGVLIVRRILQPGDILMLGSAMGAILGRLQQAATINEQYQNAIVSARRLHEVLAAEPTVPVAAAARPLPPGPGAVRFEHVTFGYDPAKPVLHDISFEVGGGKVVALVGPTGAGKTTLVQLLARFYDPQQGRIFVDGHDIREISLDSLRTQIAFVFQETYLFSDSVEANIAYGRPHARGALLESASRLARAHDFVDSLPKGYQTVLGERGTTLSGGQRQRLAIARAIFAIPRILILDDATASVDPETEEIIHGGVRFVMEDCTLFVIAHRLNTVRRADLVIVLQNGRISQMGTHAQLMEQEGHYRDIAAVQLYGEDYFDAEGEPLSHLKRVRDLSKVDAAQALAKSREEPGREREI